MIETERYPLNVFWSEEDGGYIAVATDLPGCSAFGKTQAKAIAEAQDAIASWIEAARAAGNPIPAPSKPADRERYSGKVLVRMPKSLHAKLARSADAEGVSLNHLIVYILSDGHTSMHRTDQYFSALANIGSVYIGNSLYNQYQTLCVNLPKSATLISSATGMIETLTGIIDRDVVTVKPGVLGANAIKVSAALT